MPEAARVDDPHKCPCPTPKAHVGGPIIKEASPNTETNAKQAARATDQLMCTPVGLKNFIVTGSKTVTINGKLAARKSDFTMHAGPGKITGGSPNVIIGGARAGVTLGNPDKAAKRCQEAAKGRTSGSTSQSYNNCGVESSRQLINENGNPIDEDTLLNNSMASGDAQSAATRFASGGTQTNTISNILNNNGVPAHEVGPGMDNITQNVAEGNGVITAHDAGVLWNDRRYLNGGHAINATGLEYGADGKLKNVIVNDTGVGQCAQKKDAKRFRRSLLGANSIVSNNPIWGRP